MRTTKNTTGGGTGGRKFLPKLYETPAAKARAKKAATNRAMQSKALGAKRGK